MKAFLKIVVILLVVLVFVVGGLYIIMNFGKKPDVNWTQKDYESLIQKTGVDVVDIDQLNIEHIARGMYEVTGQKEVETQITSEEFSAMVGSANDKNGPVRDFRIKFGQSDDLEMSFKLAPDIDDLIKESGLFDNLNSDSITMLSLYGNNTISLTKGLVDYLTNVVNNKPIYAKGTLIKGGDNSVFVDIEVLNVGLVPLDQNTIKQVEEKTEEFVNNFITSENGFMLEELKIEDGVLYYKGTLPSEIEGVLIE